MIIAEKEIGNKKYTFVYPNSISVKWSKEMVDLLYALFKKSDIQVIIIGEHIEWIQDKKED